MKISGILTMMLICLPTSYAIFRVFLALRNLDPLLIIGFTFLILLLSDSLAEVITPITLATVLTSIALLYLGYPIPFLSLASGYLISSNLIILLITKSEAKPHLRLSVYLLSIFISMIFLRISQDGLTIYGFFMKLVGELLNFSSNLGELSDPIFLILLAPSTIGLLSTMPVNGDSIASIFHHRELSIALFLAALPLFLISALPGDVAWIVSTLTSLAASISLIIYLRAIR